MDQIAVTVPKGKVQATTAFLVLCQGNGWEESAVEKPAEMPTESFRWLCTPSGWRAKQVDVRAFFDDSEQTRFELRGRSKEAGQIAAAFARRKPRPAAAPPQSAPPRLALCFERSQRKSQKSVSSLRSHSRSFERTSRNEGLTETTPHLDPRRRKRARKRN